MHLHLKDRVVLITGAGSGIGQAIALAFYEEGARVIVNDIDAQACESTIALMPDSSRGSVAAFDVSRLVDVQDAVKRVEAEFGAVDVLVNNAAVMMANEPFIDSDPRNCEREIAVGLFGTLNCTRAVLNGMKEQGGGRIVNIVSDAGRVGQEKEAAYSSAKGGVISFTKSLAREVGRYGIGVNAVSPAATNTPLRRDLLHRLAEKIGADGVAEREAKVRRAYPMRRIGEPEDTANAVVFLASAAAAYITGQILSVNGGYAMPG